jgi:hypothetical protein
MQRFIRTLKELRYNVDDTPHWMPAGPLEVKAVEGDGTVIVSPPFHSVEIHVHPAEFEWVSGNYLDGELDPQPQENPMATTTEAPNRPRKKAKAPLETQTELEGEGFEKPPKKVIEACRLLRQSIIDKTEATNAEKEARQSLLEKMTEAGLERVKVDDKIYEVNHDDKIKVKAIKGDEGSEA